MSTKRFFTFLTALTFVLVAQIGFASDPQTVATKQTDNMPLKIDLLYVQVAPSATVTKVCGKDKQCHYQLTLDKVSPYILTFNNGTPRVGGSILASRFIKQYYAKSGKSSELNSALMTFENGKVQEHLIVIENPTYNAKTHQMIYNFQMMNDENPIADNAQLTNVALFIDSVCAICITP